MNPVEELFIIGVEVTLVSDEPLTDEQITGLIEAIVDDLDHLPGLEPSVGTTRSGENVVMEVQVMAEDDSWEAFDWAVATIRSSLHAAGIGTAGWVRPSHMQAGYRQLENA